MASCRVRHAASRVTLAHTAGYNQVRPCLPQFQELNDSTTTASGSDTGSGGTASLCTSSLSFLDICPSLRS